MELRADVVPKVSCAPIAVTRGNGTPVVCLTATPPHAPSQTAENFRALCTGVWPAHAV